MTSSVRCESRIRVLDSVDASFERDLGELLQRGGESMSSVEQDVAKIIEKVRVEGDAALIELSLRFDRVSFAQASDFELPKSRIDRALTEIPQALAEALQEAASRVRQYHEHQKQTSWEYIEDDGTRLGQRVTPVARAGLYVPGGLASYPSSVLMTAVPASVAGVGEIIMTVPTPDGEINPAVLAAASIAGVDRVFTIGGAQAIAALAFGTDSIPRVDKIVGPGNIYVATAKRQVFGQVGIDMIAGPSEILVIADDPADAEWIAIDLFAQAEHDELAQSILVTPSKSVITAVLTAIERLLPTMARKDVIAKSLSDHGALIQVPDLNACVDLANRVAPEHLEILTKNAAALVDKITNAGAIFVGRHSAEVLGDYCAGPSHVLPTAGTARFSSPLGVYDFQKRTSVIAASSRGASHMALTAYTLARSEGLDAHARSAQLRAESGVSNDRR